MNADDLTANASLVGRVLMGAGAILLMARMGLWYHLRRLDGLLLTIASIVILLAGFVLTAAAWTGTDGPWRDSLRTMTVSRFWDAWTDSGWHRFALGFLVAGVLMVLVREYGAVFKRSRAEDGGPDRIRETGGTNVPDLSRPSSIPALRSVILSGRRPSFSRCSASRWRRHRTNRLKGMWFSLSW